MTGVWNLPEEVIKKSVAKTWECAVKEWCVDKVFLREGSACACGKEPITKVMVLVNENNGEEILAGRCCAKKYFEGMERFFDVMQRLKRDQSKSATKEIIEKAYKDGIINEWEYEFYMDTIRKKKMTEKQREKRRQINVKLVNKYARI